MQPDIRILPGVVAENYRAWKTLANAPVRAVIKCNAYNWGYETIVRALDALCEGYCVADVDELLQARRFTKHPIVVLGDVAPERVPEALDAGGLVNIASTAILESVVAWTQASGSAPTVRIGVLPAAGWSGLNLSEIEALAMPLAAARLPVEVWTHITDPASSRRQAGRLAQAAHTIRGSGTRVVGTDIASTYPLAQSRGGSGARVGIGLFGSTGGARVPGVRCALHVSAPVVRSERLLAGATAGYGSARLTAEHDVVTARCGYGDGLPRGLAKDDGEILSVGMQYVIARRPEGSAAELRLLDERADLDAFAARAGISAHEVVTAFGNASRHH